jgi:hypothetical protein
MTKLGISVAMMMLASFGGVTLAEAADRPATKAEIEKIAVGRTVNGKIRYMPNGRYTYAGGSPGAYKISAGKVCVRFDNGRSRCDRIVTADGKVFAMITSSGERYPYK